jgi:hypothetical protein
MALCGVLLLLAVAGQLRNGWLLGQSSLMDSDPPAHFVSGVMVYDYLRHAAGADPVPFAESYYVRYPKVAIGHWPPVYYALQAGWYSLFGAHLVSARTLSALIVVLLAAAIGWTVRRTHGPAIALGTAAVFLASPIVLEYTWAAMSDPLTALFVWLMLLAAAPLLDRCALLPRPAAPRMQASVPLVARLALPGALALLTKGTAWVLAPWFVIAPLLARRPRAFRGGACWASVVLILMLGAPFYLMMRASAMSYPVDAGALATAGSDSGIGLMTRLAFVRPLTLLAPSLVLALALLGAIDAIHARWRRGDEGTGVTLDLIAAAWIAAQVTFFFVLPLTEDTRAWFPSLPPIMLLMARAVSIVERNLSTRASGAVLVVPLLFGGAILSADFSIVRVNPVEGYRAAASAVPYPAGGTLILISSDSPGEGAFIVERLIADPARAGVVLRGVRMIADANWSGSVVRARLDTARAVRDHLVESQVRYVVIDSSARSGPHDPQRQLLKQAVEDDPATFRPFGRFAVTDRLGRRRGELRVYENPAAGRPRETRVQLGLDRGGRTLVYRWP